LIVYYVIKNNYEYEEEGGEKLWHSLRYYSGIYIKLPRINLKKHQN